MTSLYDIGETVLIPYMVTGIHVDENGKVLYDINRSSAPSFTTAIEEEIHGSRREKPLKLRHLEEKA